MNRPQLTSSRAWSAVFVPTIVAATALALSVVAQAQQSDHRYRISGAVDVGKSNGGTYRLDVFTIEGGGGSSVSPDARYRLQGTIGQADAQAAGTSPRYRLQGGFWIDGGPASAVLFKNSFENP